jgi:hypothetical protein
MRKQFYFFSGLVIAASCLYIVSCNNSEDKTEGTSTETKSAMSQEDMIKRGDYLVTIGSCHDCHSPKNMQNFTPDSSKLLSGHTAGSPLPGIDANAGKPGGWLYFAQDVTAFIGPWGISYAANLSPDSATGIGAWTEDQFIQTLRNGKHLGNGRDLLPPMPWPFIGKMTDEDLKSVFAYLKSLPAVSNRVPAPVIPPDLEKMKK